MKRSENNEPTAMQLLEHMFGIELAFLKSETKTREMLATAFHREVIVREPPSLPYAGDWKGLDGVAALLGRMNDTWSDVRVEELEAVRTGQKVFMTCKLILTSRASGATVTQPFAEALSFEDGLLLDGTPFYFDTAELLSVLKVAP